VDDLIDWMVDADFRQWQSVTGSLAERRRDREGRRPGDDMGDFSSDRSRLIASVGREAQRVVETYDRTRESAALAEGARSAVAAAARGGSGRGRPRCPRHGGGHDRRRRSHGPADGQRGRGAWILHPSREAPAG